MRDTLPKRFQSVHETAFLLYKVMIRNIENGQKGPKGNIEKEKKQKEEETKEQKEEKTVDKTDLTTGENERVCKETCRKNTLIVVWIHPNHMSRC